MLSNNPLLNSLGLQQEAIKSVTPYWKRVHYRAVVNWLTQYKAPIDSPNLEQIKGYIESFHHLCEVENWESAQQLLFSPLEHLAGNHLSLQLDQWSYFREEINLAQRLVEHLNSLGQVDCLIIIGDGYLDLGQLNESLKAFQAALSLARESSNSRQVLTCLLCLGLVFQYKGDFPKALEYYEEGLDIKEVLLSEEFEDIASKAKLLGNLGLTYHHLDRYYESVEVLEESLQLFYKLEDFRGESISLSNLGMAYNTLGEHEQAIVYVNRSLEISYELEDLSGQASALNILGMSYLGLGDFQRSIELHQEQLSIAKSIEDLREEANALGNLCIVNERLEKYPEAIMYAEKQLQVVETIGDKRGKGAALHSLGISLFYTSRIAESLDNLKQALKIFQEVSSQSEEAEVLKDIAAIYQEIGNLDMALDFCKMALKVSQKLGSPLVKECEEIINEILNMSS